MGTGLMEGRSPQQLSSWAKVGGCLRCLLLIASVWMGAGCNVGQRQGERQPPQASVKAAPSTKIAAATPTDSLQKPADKPLLLEESSHDQSGASPGTDNSRCLVCHLNFQEEDLTARHAKARIGCAGCHGESDAHIADESWASGGNGTPPEVMFPRGRINAFCLGCHARETIDDSNHQALWALTDAKPVCTDCHGKHRMAARKCKWK
jgi:hypothetical protein